MISIQQIGLLFADDASAALGERFSARGFAVTVYDMRPEARRDTRTRIGTCERAATLTDLGIASTIVVSTLADLTALKDACLGSSDRPGFAHELRPGSILIDLGLVSPGDVRRLSGLLAAGAISVVDAAIFAGRDASSGAPIVLASGWPEAIDNATPILETFGAVHVAGQIGATKTLAAFLLAVAAATERARAEARAVAARLGGDPAAMANLLAGQPGPLADDPRLRAAADLAREHGFADGLIANLRASLPKTALETC